jgi:hypothetical protein
MSLSLYNQRKAQIDALMQLLRQQIQAAEDINDISGKRQWTELLETLEGWNSASSEAAFPVSDEIYRELGVEPIRFEEASAAEPPAAEVVEVPQPAEAGQPKATENPIQSVLTEVETKVASAADKYTLDMAQRLLEAANLKIANENLSGDLAAEAKRLDALLREKKTALAQQKIDDAQKAVAAKDHASARALFKEAQELAGRKNELYDQAQKLIDELPTEVERGDIDLNLYQVEHSPDIHEVEISLRILETYIRSGRLTKDDLQRITAARERFNRVRAEQGIGLSIMRIGDLQNKYLLYLRAVEGKLGYEDNDVNVTNAMGAYQQQSLYVTKDEMEKSRILAAESPLAARNKVRALLDEKVTVEITYMVGSKGLSAQKVSGKDTTEEEVPILKQTLDEKTGMVRETRIIRAFPIQKEERNKFEDFLKDIKDECDSEEQALAIRTEGENAGDEYTKLDRYVQARGIFKLRGLDEKIKETLAPAAIARREFLKGKLLELNSRLQNLVHLQQSEIKDALEKIEAEYSWLAAHMNDWRANGVELILSAVRVKCAFPEELKEFIEKELRPGLDDFQRDFIPAKTAFLRLCSLADGIRADLNDASPATRAAAINTFHQIEVTDRVKGAAIYRELDALVTGNADFNSVYQDILAEKEKKEWSLLVGHIEQLKTRRDYANCPITIQQGIEAVRKEAEPEFYLESLTAAMHTEDYTGALDALEWLNKNNVTRPSLAEQAAALEMLRTSGAKMQEFYRQTLSAANLAEMHPLVGVLFQRKKLVAMALNRQVNEESVRLMQQICGEGYYGFSEDAYLAALKKHIQAIATRDLESLLSRLDYVAGRARKNQQPDWPEYADCIAKNNALELARYLRQALRDLLMERAQTPASAAKELRTLIEAAFAVKVVFSESDLQQLVGVDYKLAQEELKSAVGDELRYKKWQVLHRRWPSDQRIGAEWQKSLIQHYQREITSLREMAKYPEAYQKVEEALNDEEIGAQDQFYFEKVGICLELNQQGEAQSILDELTRRISGPEVTALATQVRITGILAGDQGAPSEVIRRLIELSQDSRYNAAEIDQHIKDAFQKHSQIFRNEIEALRDGQKLQALIQVLRYSQLETEYQEYIPGYVEQAHKYVIELSPSLFETGRELSTEFGELLRRCDAPDQSDSLVVTIAGVKDALSKGRPFISLFTRFLPQLKNRSGLQNLVEELIAALEPDALKRQNLQQLLRTSIPAGTPSLSFVSLQSDVSQLGSKLGKLENELAQLNELCQSAKWESAVQNVFRNQATAWGELETGARRLGNLPEFSEIRQFSVALGIWKARLAEIYSDCLKLSDDYVNEMYEDARTATEAIQKRVDELPAFSGSSVPQSVRARILELVSVADMRSGNFFGMERVRTQINALLQELADWQAFNQRQDSTARNAESYAGNVLRYYETFWSGLLVDEKKLFEGGYNLHMQGLRGATATGNLVLPPGAQPPQAGVHPPLAQAAPEAKGFMADLFGKAKKDEAPLVKKLRRPFSNPAWAQSALDEQKKFIERILENCRQFYVDEPDKPAVNSARAEQFAAEYSAICVRVANLKASGEALLGDIGLYEMSTPYPTKEELEHHSIAKQHIKMAQKIIAADYLGPREGYINATYRPTVISALG